jgi:hypothetical protein
MYVEGVSDLTMIAKVPRKESGSIRSWLIVAIFIVLSTGLLLLGIQASSPSKTKETQRADSSKTEQKQVIEPLKTEQMLYDVNLATLAANRDFPKFLAGAWTQKMKYGFKAADEQNDVSLANPIFVYGIDEEIVGKLNKEEDLAAAVEPVGEWIYPVQVKREYRTLFGVRLRSNNEWRGTYLGNPYLAASLQGIRKIWSSKNGDEFKLVSCIQPRAFFFIALHTDKPNLTPVTRISLGKGQYLAPPADWHSITPAGAVLESLKRFWKADMNDVPLDSI